MNWRTKSAVAIGVLAAVVLLSLPAGKATRHVHTRVDPSELPWCGGCTNGTECLDMDGYVQCFVNGGVLTLYDGQSEPSFMDLSNRSGGSRRLSEESLWWAGKAIRRTGKLRVRTNWQFPSLTLDSPPKVYGSTANPRRTKLLWTKDNGYHYRTETKLDKNALYRWFEDKIYSDDRDGALVVDYEYTNWAFRNSNRFEVFFDANNGGLVVLKAGATCDGVITTAGFTASTGGQGGGFTLARACDRTWFDDNCELVESANLWTCDMDLGRRYGRYRVRVAFRDDTYYIDEDGNT